MQRCLVITFDIILSVYVNIACLKHFYSDLKQYFCVYPLSYIVTSPTSYCLYLRK